MNHRTRAPSRRPAAASWRLLGALLLSLATGGPAQAAVPASTERFVRQHGSEYGLALDGDKNLLYRRHGVFGTMSARPERLEGPVLARMTGLFDRIQGQPPHHALVPVLKALVPPAPDGRSAIHGEALTAGDGRAEALTPFGRTVLMDLLTAEDGAGIEGPWQGPGTKPAPTPQRVMERLVKEGAVLQMAGQAQAALARAGGANALFDGAGAPPQAVVPMDAYGRWRELERGKAQGVYADPKTGHVHLVVAARETVAQDRYRILNKSEERSVLKETGIDAALIARHHGRVVRAIDNLIEIDLTRRQAARLGRKLDREGIHSAPDMALNMADAAARQFTQGGFPLSGLLPMAKNAVGSIVEKVTDALTGGRFHTKLNDAKDILKADGLWKNGMEGEGTVVGIIDSGLDTKHPDFQGRVLTYIDLVQGGFDAIGHGTHVAGLTGGDGKASDGLFKGMAPKTKFVVMQIFGPSGGGASEMSVLAAMKIMSSLPKHLRPDVVNMSLGINPPIGNNLHSTSLLADWIMARDNVFMSIAAGNSGPEQYTVGSPGNARHVLTVTGTDKQKQIPFFPSRGPVVNWPFKEYNKPDIATVAGGVDRANPCPYAPGLIAARSSTENFPLGHGDTCFLPDHPQYRYMSGTSMATPLATGIAADVIGYLKSKGIPYTTAEVKALMMETADDLGRPAYEQGAGIVNGEKLAEALMKRAKAGASAGNVAWMLAQQVPEFHRWYLERRKGVVATQAGLLDTRTQHIIHTDDEIDAVVKAVDEEISRKPLWERLKIKAEFALHRAAAQEGNR